jgi:hypothetical protein
MNGQPVEALRGHFVGARIFRLPLILAGLGFAIGAVIGLAHGSDPSGELIAYSAGDYALIFGFGLGVVGLGVGLLVAIVVVIDRRIPRRRRPNRG